MSKLRADVYIKDKDLDNIFYGSTKEEIEDAIIEWTREKYSEMYGGSPFYVTVNVVVEENYGATWEPVWDGDMEVYIEPQDE